MIRKVSSRFCPRSLAGQIVLLVLVAVIASHIVSFAFMADERRLAVRAAQRMQVLERAASIHHLLDETPADLHDKILASVSSRNLQFWLNDQPTVSLEEATSLGADIKGRLENMIGLSNVEIRVKVTEGLFGFWGRSDDDHPRRHRHWDDDDDDDHDEYRGKHHRGIWKKDRRFVGLVLSIQQPNNRWLNIETNLALAHPPMGRAFFWTLVIVLLFSAVAIFMARRVVRPVKNLGLAAEQAGRGETPAPVKEEGPADIRETIRSFNTMQERLTRFVEDRTRMLAAISHDLRTPITTLRLRAEFIEDKDIQAKILQTLDEMQKMTEATLDFAREESLREDTRTVDLSSLISSVIDDMTELGEDVIFDGVDKCPYDCRPMALKRAIRNLVENATKYGKRARISLEDRDDTIIIAIEDNGPGIPEAEQEDVFKPFFRLDKSRSTETGGIGMGLAIVRSIIQSHGGEVVLKNGRDGGLIATVALPKK